MYAWALVPMHTYSQHGVSLFWWTLHEFILASPLHTSMHSLHLENQVCTRMHSRYASLRRGTRADDGFFRHKKREPKKSGFSAKKPRPTGDKIGRELCHLFCEASNRQPVLHLQVFFHFVASQTLKYIGGKQSDQASRSGFRSSLTLKQQASFTAQHVALGHWWGQNRIT
uniref:Putative secreted protein n=1 Tax=Ixodes ricinus TaxID=34613 RepID=A0A6B0UYV1_IXORI